jgi:hypothetical protein
VYTFQGQLSGSDWYALGSILSDCYDGARELQDFLREKFGRRVASSVNWDRALRHACSDVVSYFERQCAIGKLITELALASPDEPNLNALIQQLKESGQLTYTMEGAQ